MLVGFAPFQAKTTFDTQVKVINWRETLVFPEACKLSDSSRDLVFKLCTYENERLNADGIKAHSFFKGFDFGSQLRRSKAPYIPVIKHPTDTSNFEPIDNSNLIEWQTKKQRNRLLAQQQRQQMASQTNAMPMSPHPHDQQASAYSCEPVLYEFTFRRFFDEAYTTDNVCRYELLTRGLKNRINACFAI